MKNFNLIEWLQTDSHGKQSATRVHHGTKSRELHGNPRPLRYPCATLALPLRYVAMIFAVLTLSIANIGMAWGVDITVTRFALNGTTIYAINQANKIFHDEVEFTLSTTPSLNSNLLNVPASSVLTIRAHGKTITKIVIEWNSANNSSTFSSGSASWENSNKTMTWTGSTTSLAITSGAASRVNSAVITYTDADPLSGVTTTTLSSFSRIYSSSGACMYSSKTNSAYGVNIQGGLDSNNPVGLSKKASNSLFTNGLRLVSPKPISSVVYTWTVAPTTASVSSGTYDSSTSTWTAANTTTTEVTIYNNGTATAKFSQIVVNFVGSTPECEDVDAPTSLSCTAHTQTSLTFGWTKASDASGYVAKLWDNSSCTGDAVATENIANGNTETVTFSGLTAGTTYYCKVQSKGDGTEYCENGGSTSAANGTTDACTAISPTWSYPFSTVAVGITIYPTIGGNTGGGAVTYSSSATSNITNDCNATAAGSATLTANIAANGAYCSGSVTSGTITVVSDQSGLIKQTLTTGNNEWGTPSAPATTDGTNITSTTVLSATDLTISGNGNTSNGGQTAKITGMTADSEGDNSGKYMRMGFTVKSGKQLNVSAIYIPVQPVSSDVNNIKAVLTDGETTITGTLTNSKNGKLAYIKFNSYGTVKGNVTLTLYAWGWTGGYRLGKSIVIDGEIEDAPSSCTDPDHVGISGSWRYFPGQTISLTATGYDDSDEEVVATGYQWQKEVSADNWSNLSNGTEAGVTISGATTNNLQITPCGTGNTGKYRCIVSTGATCSTTSPGFDVRIYTLNGAYDNNSFSSNNITYSSGTAGTATVHLEAGRVYKFKVTDNFGTWFGNSGKILEPAVNWDFSSGEDDNCVLFTGPEGDYTFTVDYAHADYGTPEVVVSVAYPSVTHPSAGYAYFKNVDSWEHVALHMWYDGGGAYTEWASDPWVTKTTTICGETYYYTPFIPSWYNRCIFHNAGGDGQTGDITVANLAAYSGKYNDKSDANWHSFTTYTITFAANGGSGTMSAITGICPDADKALTANAYTKTGYTFGGWKADVAVTIDGVSKAAGTVIDDQETLEAIGGNITLTAQWTAKQCTVAFDNNGGTGTITSVTATYDAAMPSKASNLPTKTGYSFAGFYDGSGGTGTKYYNADGSSAKNWDKNTTSTTTLYAKWTANTPTITLDDQDATNTPTGSVVATYGSAMPSIATLPTKTGYTFGGFYSSVAGGGTKYYNADGSSAKNSDLASATTLYALWTQSVTIDDNGGSADGSVSVTYKGTAGTPSVPTYAGHTVDLGYYAESSCTNKVMALDGTLQTNVTDGSSVVWTNSSSKWAHAGASTLYAHWKCNTPTITDNGDNTVSITVPSGTTVRYTTDGTNPSSSTGTVYSTTFSIAADCTVKAIAYQSNCTDSEIASQACDYTAPANFQMIANSSAASDATLDLNEYISQGSKNCTTLTGGTAQYQGNSGKTMTVNKSNGSGTSQYYGWYFNSSGDKIVVTLTSHILQVGSIISVEGYGANGNGITANTSTSLLNGTGSQQQWSASHTVVAGDTHLVGKNVITFDRYNSCRIFSITISNCQTGTMCVTPVLPSLTTPNQGCTTGDFAAWNATVTNASAISAASGSQSVSYSWKNSSSVEVATTASYKPSAAGTYTVTATVHSDASGYIDAKATSSTLTASLYGNPSVTGPSDAEYEVGESASNLSVTATPTHGETLTYQWYRNTAKSTSSPTPTALANCTTSTYKPSTAAAATTYYFCKISGGCAAVYSDIATVTVSEASCFKITDAGKNGSSWPKSNGNTIANSDIDGTITGGTVTYTGSGSLTGNDTHGIIFDNDNDELTISLSGSHALVAGSVITIVQHGNSSTSKETGFKVSGNSMSPATCNNGSTANKEMTQTYTVAAADGIAGTSGFTIKWTGTNQVYLKSITVTGCVECTPITPSLSYSKTTFWMDDATLTATPTLTGYYGSPTISYASSDPTVVRVDNSSTGAITALKRGTATITATIGATTVSTTDYCGNTATCVITVKDMECGNTTIAKATRSGTSASYSGVEGGSALVNNLDGSNYKLKSGGYVGVQLPSTLSFEAGDIVRIDLTIGDWWNGASADELPVVVYADNTGTNEIYRTDNYKKLTAQVVEFEVTSSMLTALATKQVTVYRQSSTETQNHVVNSVEIKRYACPDVYVFDAADNGLWSDEDNWLGATGHGSGIPTIEDRAIITKPITVDIAHATAAAVILDQSDSKTGKLTINPNKGLEVAGTIRKTTDGSSYSATGEADLVLESSSAGNASLIFNNNNNCHATVQMYAKGSISGSTWNWQYVGTPFTGSIPLYNYYGSWMYKWNGTTQGWDVVGGTDELTPFAGYCLTQESATTHVMGGTLVPTTSTSVTMGTDKDMVLANSWTAPIYVGGFTASTFTFTPATIYLFNTGSAENGSSKYVSGDEAGTYVTIPVKAAEYTGNEFIAPMQGFFVTTNGGSAGSITMNYNDLVRPSGVHTGIVAGPMKAPRRAKVADAKPDVMKIWANGSEYNDRVVILAREDFSEGFDNGWDGEKLSFGNASPSVYVINEEGGYDAVSAIPEYEGTLVGFRAGSEDNVYTMTFEYNGDEVLYLNDLKAQMSAEIANGQTYMFTTEEGDSEVRFIISQTPIRRITTGVDEVVGGTKVRKIIINDKVYIIRKGRVYSVDGSLIK